MFGGRTLQPMQLQDIERLGGGQTRLVARTTPRSPWLPAASPGEPRASRAPQYCRTGASDSASCNSSISALCRRNPSNGAPTRGLDTLIPSIDVMKPTVYALVSKNSPEGAPKRAMNRWLKRRDRLGLARAVTTEVEADVVVGGGVGAADGDDVPAGRDGTRVDAVPRLGRLVAHELRVRGGAERIHDLVEHRVHDLAPAGHCRFHDRDRVLSAKGRAFESSPALVDQILPQLVPAHVEVRESDPRVRRSS